ncbi:MAG: hypothetical protein HC886_21735 [Leptolyngbyaceae cyanobacterium SM1_1_3]|nr:hypothetical protein [Leptolyngbyaceae cyanobacterium SM1_1_3]NJM85649.1 hypothetical protein [Leptolyngbyaceae cyanobacterium RM2_2_21]NJN03459.1 hypothetical protein [Leptolyngbyaceae cyanobacterium RM1_1_2]NJO08778.1 hypothetical protein [Leptolyngbyaceae cyanobacterium SL_1_1]
MLIQLAKGSSNREIAQSLQITDDTAENYLTRIFSKLGGRDRV